MMALLLLLLLLDYRCDAVPAFRHPRSCTPAASAPDAAQKGWQCLKAQPHTTGSAPRAPPTQRKHADEIVLGPGGDETDHPLS